MNHLWLAPRLEDVETERLQCEQEGRDLSAVTDELRTLEESDLADFSIQELLDRISATEQRTDFPYEEPDDLDAIRALVPANRFARIGKVDDLEDRIEGAWYGRCAGCLLGKPVEGWKRPRIEGYLRDTGRFPLDYYFSCEAPAGVLQMYSIDRKAAFIENVKSMPEDDDMNYTTVALAVLEKHDRGFTSEDVANFWLDRIPILRTCTAERVAYRNIANGILPPASATYRNPYREWIGAQIRADMWGYVNPGDPQTAAEYAWRDARVSHVKNGIYGEMWVAAMLAAAFVESAVAEVIAAGLGEIPERSRIAEAIRRQISNRQTLGSPNEAIDDIHSRWDEHRPHDWCHVISNAEVVAMSLLWGNKDYERSICLAVQSGFDTDCNGATVGSIIGAMQGRFFLPERWMKPLDDTLETGVQGFHRVSIEKMAARTMRQAKT